MSAWLARPIAVARARMAAAAANQVPAPLRPAGSGTSIKSFAVVSARASMPTASHSAQLTVRETTIRCTRVLYSAAATRITSVAATPNRTGSR